ncbi:MAG: HAD family phosphatase [Clostridia bacterium]|nr:HAD family phosphatase [Clostridia bacterium]
MKYKMIAIDMDGTLLTKDKKITEETAAALRAAANAGVLVVISTGRPAPGVEMYHEITDLGNPVIIYNGAGIIKYPEKKIIFDKGLPGEPAAKILAAGKAYNTAMCIWSQGQLYVNIMDERCDRYETLSGMKAHPMPSECELLNQGITKILWYDTPERISFFIPEMKKLLGSTSSCCPSAPEFLEFFHPEVSKAAAIEIVAAEYGIKREEIAAIGDGCNDIEMIEYAGLGIAMQNAPDIVKEHSDFITKSNSGNGVAYAINKILNI